MSYKTKQNTDWRIWLGRLLGLSVLGLMTWQLMQQEDLGSWWYNFQYSLRVPGHWIYLCLVIVLMPINWCLEIAKWRKLLQTSWSISWWSATRFVLAGISVSLATPNRIGEYGGRLLLAPTEQTANIVFSSIVGSICQWIAFIICGWPALIFWCAEVLLWPVSLKYVLAMLIPVLLLIGLFTIPWLLRRQNFKLFFLKWKWWRWFRRKATLVRQLERRVFLQALLLALVRFWVYTSQYLILLWFFNVSLNIWVGISGIFCIYLIQAGIPLPPGLGVITRSEIALLIWGADTVTPLAVVSATFSLYVINLVLPSLLGSYLLVKMKTRKN
ncbi:MAG: lysylphosphatidylglycerol synthase domain-containing protein [Bacteroidota bacterium]